MTEHREATGLTDAEARRAVAEAVRKIVPDADVEALPDDEPIRAEFELDSLDFLTFVETLHQRTGVRIDEEDYAALATMATCVAFLTGSR
jgi:acyl carrier protein